MYRSQLASVLISVLAVLAVLAESAMPRGARAQEALGVGAAQAAVPPPVDAVARTDDMFSAMQCRDKFGREVSLVKVANLGDIGRAWYMSRVPIIAMDPHVAGKLPDKLVRFFYDHECAHHALGHWFMYAAERENDADCWAVTRARDAGRLSRDEIVGFAPFFAASAGSSVGHLPGPLRIKHLLFCFDKPQGG